MGFFKKHGLVIVTGLIVGIIAVALVAFGNPKNMGFCIACFLRDIAGGVGMHRAEVVQYVRPEIIGLVLGALIMSLVGKEFAPKGGSAPLIRFVLGFAVMVGALMFLGCPLRMIIRIGGGDLNAVVGLVGFVIGILMGIFFLNKGFTLKRTYDMPKLEGYIPSAISLGLFILLVFGAGLLFFSEKGPGSMRAPIAIALIAGLVVGALAQKSRLCMVGGLRDAIMFKDGHLLYGFIAIIVAVLLGNLLTGAGVNFSFADQPVAHTDGLWNALGMVLVGFASVLLGGCPLRQLILAGSGNADSGVAVLGMTVGAAFCHNFKLASSGDGPTLNGQIAVMICLVLVALIAVMNLQKQKD
ncbi:MAG: YedE-related selenium metabolism membrane protein [Clostridia bacterium]|nr:YedE family putative selenium transporter [Candidatus Pelethousia sp.]NCB30538.1 YedE-related selenium metabolism membrane protein [Clostridia bacterium]